MSLLIALLALVAGVHLCVGDEKEDALWAALSTDLPAVKEEIIGLHNDFRRKVVPSASNMLKMDWNDEAKENCEKWAKQCNYNHSPQSQRIIGNGTKCGENLFFSSNLVSWLRALQAWYDEEKDFTFNQGPKFDGAVIGHYTAMVWYRSYLTGCAVAKCPGKEMPYFFVCQYCPAGNVKGPKLYQPYTAGKPCGACPNNCDAGLCTNPCKRENEYSNCDDLKKDFSCEHPFVKANCPESCECTTEIR